MARNRFSRGDRVRLDPVQADRWVNLFKKFAQTGREATVLLVRGVPMGATRYLLRFDVKRKGSIPKTLECIEQDMLFVRKG